MTRLDRLERHAPHAAVVLVVIGLILRVRGVGEYWLNPDEGIYYSTLTWPTFEGFWAEVMANAHPPGFYLLLRGVGYLTWDFVWLRAPSVVFGVVAIWMFWLVGRELGGSGLGGAVTGLVAAALLALNPNAIVLSQVIRPYTLLVLLLSGGLLALLRYRSEPDGRWLVLYAALLTLATLSHYSAALGLAVLSLLLAHDVAIGGLRGRAAARALTAHAVPVLVFGALYLLHVRSALDSELMGEALGSGGWLGGWLVDSPRAAWANFVTYQEFHLPESVRVRTAIALLASIGLAATAGDRAVAVLGASALAVGLTASALGLYPLGETRHSFWLSVFTIPALASLVGHVATRSRNRALAGVASLAILFAGGGSLERLLGPPPRSPVAVQTVGTRQEATRMDEADPLEERVIRVSEIAHLIVERMDPEGEPETIVTTEQTYNVLMPLYAAEREDRTLSADSTLLRFDYGTREIVVVRTWDWEGVDDLARRLRSIPGSAPEIAWKGDVPVLVLIGGWGSPLLPQVMRLGQEGVVTEVTVAPGLDPAGRFLVRVAAVVVDPRSLARR